MDKKKYMEEEKMWGMKVQPVNMHGQPVSEGKGKENLDAVVEGMNMRLGCNK
jgi:hypothetical protein